MKSEKQTMEIRIGNTTFTVNMMPGEKAKETHDSMLRKMITKEALSPAFDPRGGANNEKGSNQE